MPIKRCNEDGVSGWKYGDSGKCYKSREDAIKQMKAIKYSQTHGEIDFSNEGLTNEELLRIGLEEVSISKTKLKIGDRVKVKSGKEHDEMTKDKVGIIKKISTSALGIMFEDMDEIHKWYIEEEIQRLE